MNRILILVAFFVFACQARADQKPFVKVGQLAPDFSLSTLDGGSFRLKDYLGKQAVYVVFWNTWCGYCIKKVPKINQIQKELGDELAVIAVNTSWSDSLKEIADFQATHNTQYQIAFDDNASVTEAYGVYGSPTEFIIDINGVVRYRDDVPNNFTQHIASWNRLNGETQIAELCQQEQEVC